MNTQQSAGEPAQDSSGSQLETAHQRLLTYLKALHVPVSKRYELAQRSLELAEKDQPPEERFIAAAMQHLNTALHEYRPEKFQKELDSIVPMPPLNRGAMVPVVLDRSGPFAFFLGALVATGKKLFTRPLRMYVLLLILAALLVFYWREFFR